MKIVIKISDEDYKAIAKGYLPYGAIADAIKQGTPLLEHHRLIDRLELSDHIKNRLIQTAMNNMETIMSYDMVCIDIVDNRIDTWINEVKPIIEGSDAE